MYNRMLLHLNWMRILVNWMLILNVHSNSCENGWLVVILAVKSAKLAGKTYIIHTFSLKTGFQVFYMLLPLWQNCPFSFFNAIRGRHDGWWFAICLSCVARCDREWSKPFYSWTLHLPGIQLVCADFKVATLVPAQTARIYLSQMELYTSHIQLLTMTAGSFLIVYVILSMRIVLRTMEKNCEVCCPLASQKPPIRKQNTKKNVSKPNLSVNHWPLTLTTPNHSNSNRWVCWIFVDFDGLSTA